MRSNAKAPSAGSAMRQPNSLGRIGRGAFAIRGTSSDASGSSASSRHDAWSHTPVARTRVLAFALTACALALLAIAPSAFAVKTTVNTIGAAGTTGGLFNSPAGVAVNTTGNGGVVAGTTYVVDSTNSRIQRLNPASFFGAFVSAWGWDVNQPGGDSTLEVCTVAANCKAGTSGSGAGQLASPLGIAVDQATGILYVTDQSNRRVDVFSATGTFYGAFGWGAFDGSPALQYCTSVCGSPAAEGGGAGQFGSSIGGAAVDSTGKLYVADKSNSRIDVFTPTISSGVVTAVSFTRAYGWDVAATGDPGDTAPIDQFEVCTTTCQAGSSGANLGQFGAAGPADLAIDSSNNVYALDSENQRLEKFDPTPSPIASPAFDAAAAVTADFGTGSLYALDADTTADHIYLAGSDSAQSDQIRVAELDSSGAQVATHGTDLTTASANGLGAAPAALGGNLYLSSSQPNHRVLVLNDAPSMDPVTTHTATTAHFSGTVVSNSIDVTYHFEYSIDGISWTSLPTSDIDAGTAAGTIAVEQDATGLVGSQLYHVRLVQNRELGGGKATSPEVTFTTDSAPPLISEQSASAVGVTSAALNAKVNPQNQATTYHFEYGSEGPCDANPCVSVPASDAPAGSGGVPVPLVRPISGLQPSTTYHFRLVASNGGGTSNGPDTTFTTYALAPVFDSCANDTFRIGASSRLPDCRAYEQASSLDKGGSDVVGTDHRVQASVNGDAITFYTTSGLPESLGGQTPHLFMAKRQSGTWSTNDVMTPQSEGFTASLRGGLADLSRFFTMSTSFKAGNRLITYSADDQSFAPAVKLTTQNVGVVGGSADGSLVFIQTNSKLLPEAVASRSNVYAWAPVTGALSLVGVYSDSACGTPPCVPTGNVMADRKLPNDTDYAAQRHAVSDDGDRVYWTDVTPGHIYLRQGITGPTPSTVQVSASQRTVPDPHKPASFQFASVDGSVAIFTSCEKLTNDSTAVSTAANSCTTTSQAPELYSYDVAGALLTDITPNPAEPKGANVRSVLGASADGSYVYFVANGDLDGPAGPATPGNCSGTVFGQGDTFGGQCSIYLWHSGDPIEFVARLDTSGQMAKQSDASNWAKDPTFGATPPVARVSADGKTLLFRSQASLTGYDNTGNICQTNEGAPLVSSGRCPQFYRFNTDEGLTCVSCNPTGAPPSGRPPTLTSIKSQFEPNGGLYFMTSNLSADGKRIFFETQDKLVGTDTNGELGCTRIELWSVGPFPACQDVYEWEADGSGSCESSAANGGCLYLLSTGTGSSPSFFADATPSGEDAFIFTRDRLVPQDGDNLQDVYDVSAGGGLASQHATPPPACQGDACRGAGSPSPDGQGAATAAFSGPGNAIANRCARGKVRRKGRCVAVRQKKRKHKRHHSRAANHNRRASR